MSRFVLDCSVTMAWCFDDEADGYADAVLDGLVDGTAVVPSRWPLEIANVLLVAERRGRLNKADSARFLELLGALPIEVDGETHGRAIGAIVSLGRERGLSSYDTAYLELAMRENVPLASLDQPLRLAAEGSGVSLLGPG